MDIFDSGQLVYLRGGLTHDVWSNNPPDLPLPASNKFKIVVAVCSCVAIGSACPLLWFAWVDFVIYYSLHGSVVHLDWGGWLWVSHFK